MNDQSRRTIGWLVGTLAAVLTFLNGAENTPAVGLAHKLLAAVVGVCLIVQMRLPQLWGTTGELAGSVADAARKAASRDIGPGAVLLLALFGLAAPGCASMCPGGSLSTLPPDAVACTAAVARAAVDQAPCDQAHPDPATCATAAARALADLVPCAPTFACTAAPASANGAMKASAIDGGMYARSCAAICNGTLLLPPPLLVLRAACGCSQ